MAISLLPGVLAACLGLLPGCASFDESVELARRMTNSTSYGPIEQSGSDEAAKEDVKANIFGASGTAFSPDGEIVAIGTRDLIWVADTRTYETRARMSYRNAERFGGRKSLLFIGNERLVIGGDGAIMIWDLREGLITHRLALASGLQSPRAMAWSESTQMLAFSSGAYVNPVNIVHVDRSGFGRVRGLPDFRKIPNELAFSQDGRYLAAAGDESGVSIRQVDNGELFGELPTGGIVTELEAIGRNQLLVAGADIALWTFRGDEEITDLQNPSLDAQYAGQMATKVAGGVAYASILSLVIFGSLLGVAPSGDPKDYQELYDDLVTSVETRQQAWCGRSTAISPDGKLMIDVYPGIRSELINVYDLDSGDLAKKLNPPGKYSCAAKFNPIGNQLLITSDRTARLYDTKTWTHRDLDLD